MHKHNRTPRARPLADVQLLVAHRQHGVDARG